jgi:ribosomal protein S8E
MKKIILSVLLALSVVSSLSASQKSGCVLAQKGEVKVKIDNKEVTSKVKYISVAKDGENFRSILVGSQLVFNTSDNKKIKIKIIDIKADPRVKGQPRTGLVTLDTKIATMKQEVSMKYSFSDNLFTVDGMIDELNINFSTKIETVLCNTKPLK